MTLASVAVAFLEHPLVFLVHFASSNNIPKILRNPVMETSEGEAKDGHDDGGGGGRRKTGRKDSGVESDKFPADSYLQAIPPAAEKLRPRPSFPFSPLY